MSGSLRVDVVAGACRGRVLLIPSTGATIGRGEKAEIRLDEPTLSREHCCICLLRNDWYVQDLDSHNGTFLNGQRVEKERLYRGDSVQIGDVVLRIPRGVPTMAIAAGAAVVVLIAAFFLWPRRSAASAPAAEPAASAEKSAAAKAETPTASPPNPAHESPLDKHNVDLDD